MLKINYPCKLLLKFVNQRHDWLLFTWNSSYLLAPVNYSYLTFLWTLTHFLQFPFLSLSLKYWYFLGLCPQHSFHCFCSLWMISSTSWFQPLLSVSLQFRVSPRAPDTYVQNSIAFKCLLIRISTLNSTSSFKSAPSSVCPFLVWFW